MGLHMGCWLLGLVEEEKSEKLFQKKAEQEAHIWMDNC